MLGIELGPSAVRACDPVTDWAYAFLPVQSLLTDTEAGAGNNTGAAPQHSCCSYLDWILVKTATFFLSLVLFIDKPGCSPCPFPLEIYIGFLGCLFFSLHLYPLPPHESLHPHSKERREGAVGRWLSYVASFKLLRAGAYITSVFLFHWCMMVKERSSFEWRFNIYEVTSAEDVSIAKYSIFDFDK